MDQMLIEAAGLLETIAHHGLNRNPVPGHDMDEEADNLETQALDLALRINRRR